MQEFYKRRYPNNGTPPATDRFVAVGSTRFSDGEIQTEATLAAEIRKSMLAAADRAIAGEIARLTAEVECRDALIKDHLGTIMRKENQIENLTAEVEALRVDARRYQWLRVAPNKGHPGCRLCQTAHYHEAKLDKSVDAAMAAGEPK